jgi:hypothetical protein
MMSKNFNKGQGKSRKVIIGDEFPVNDAIIGTKLYGEDLTRFVIALCLFGTFLGLGLGGAVFSLWVGDYGVFQAVWATVHTFVGILIGYYFGRHGHGGRDDKDNDAGAA